MMHTNVFDFENSHFILSTNYVKEDPMREFCGLIQVYNFLSDSLKYNRIDDEGYLITRIFINKERHFFMEGKQSVSLQYRDFECCSINTETLNNFIIEIMNYCLNFDLIAPPLEKAFTITVEQKNNMSYSSGFPTGKRLGFRMSSEKE